MLQGARLAQLQVVWHPQTWRAANRPSSLPGLYDGELARLMRIEGHTLHLQPTGYFDHWATNLQPQAPLGECADPLGINALVWDVEGSLVLNRRSPSLALRPGQLAPGFSGAVEASDLRPGPLQDCDLLRELREELGPVQPIRTRLLGLVREPERHGTPDLFLECWLPVPARALPGSAEGQVLAVKSGAEIQRRVEELGPISVPLRTAWALRACLENAR